MPVQSAVFQCVLADVRPISETQPVQASHHQLAFVQDTGAVGNQMNGTPSPANIDIGVNGGVVDYGLEKGCYYQVTVKKVAKPASVVAYEAAQAPVEPTN